MPQDPAVERVVPGTPRRAGGDRALAAFPARAPAARRWCFADQLGPHFLDRPDRPVLLIEAKAVSARRRFHRQEGAPGAVGAAPPGRRAGGAGAVLSRCTPTPRRWTGCASR